MDRKNRKILKKNVQIMRMAVLAVILLFVVLIVAGMLPKPATQRQPQRGIRVKPSPTEIAITTLDVGQGECIVIQTGGTVAMIDTGDTSNASESAILGFLETNGIKRIDLLFITHPHADHIGGARRVIEVVEVGEILFSEIPEEILPTSATYLNLLQSIEERDIPTRIPRAGEKIEFSLGAMTILLNGGYNDLNNCSLVMRYDYGEVGFLITGDIEIQVEEQLLEGRAVSLSCDILSVGHHGSRTSSGEAFLDAVSPRYGVISCKTGNSYGHPHEEALLRLQQRGIMVYRTDLDGDISFMTDGKTIMVSLFQEMA